MGARFSVGVADRRTVFDCALFGDRAGAREDCFEECRLAALEGPNQCYAPGTSGTSTILSPAIIYHCAASVVGSRPALSIVGAHMSSQAAPHVRNMRSCGSAKPSSQCHDALARKIDCAAQQSPAADSTFGQLSDKRKSPAPRAEPGFDVGETSGVQ
jgi:hypothetical protein